MTDRKYLKCHECDFMETRCYVKPREMSVSICLKYWCVTSPERNCLSHKNHHHSNYEPELVKK